MNINFNAVEINKEIIDLFSFYLENGFSAQSAIETLRYEIFVKHNDWFYSLSENQQWEIRSVLKSLELVHLN